MKKLLKSKKVININEGEYFDCFYYKTSMKCLDNYNASIFGIEIKKLYLGIEEVCIINDICVNEKDIDEILELIIMNDITPITLKEIIYDWVCLKTIAS